MSLPFFSWLIPIFSNNVNQEYKPTWNPQTLSPLLKKGQQKDQPLRQELKTCVDCTLSKRFKLSLWARDRISNGYLFRWYGLSMNPCTFSLIGENTTSIYMCTNQKISPFLLDHKHTKNMWVPTPFSCACSIFGMWQVSSFLEKYSLQHPLFYKG